MKSLYFKPSLLLLFALCSQWTFAQTSTAYFDLQACNANQFTGTQMDYNEFTAQVDNSTCVGLTVVGDNLYRNNPTVNTHSCTPGVNGSVAMCVSSNPACTFTPNSDQAIRIDIVVTPDASGSATLSELSFYEQGPAMFNWINGDSGPNNYPTLFGVRVLKNGTEVFLSADIATELDWNLNTFNFSGPEFTVSEPTTFNIELLGYCPVGNGALMSAWDIDEVRIVAACCEAPSGGNISGGPFEFCAGDDVPDNVSGLVLSGQTGPNNQWVVTDNANNIIGLPTASESFNFDDMGPGTFLIWNVSFEDGISGLVVGNNLLTALSGCFGLSNSITVVNNQPAGGTLTGGPFEFCVGDSVTDVSSITLGGNVGENSQLIITNGSNTIISLPGSFGEIDFSQIEAGTFFIYNLSSFDIITGLEPGNNLPENITGCFAISNAITVVMNQPQGGTLNGGPFEFCVGDSIPDHVSGITLTGNVGEQGQWVVTNEQNVILSLPNTPEEVNFDGGGPGICLIWHVSYFDSISGLVMGNNLLTDLSGCHAVSNSISVIRNQPSGGLLSGGPFEFCVGDSVDFSGIVLSGNVGDHSQFVITNDSNVIMGLPGSLAEIDFEGQGPGTFFIWNISSFDTLGGLVIGNNLLADITGCFGLSGNNITVELTQPLGGTIAGGPFEFCANDSIADHLTGIVLSGNTGDNAQWVLTNSDNLIIGLPNLPEEINFDGADPGTYLIWNVAYMDSIGGLVVGNNLSDLSGCFSLSNSISIDLNDPSGGLITGGPFQFCAGDSILLTGMTLSGNVGENSQFVIVNEENIIMGLADSAAEIDFDGFEAGTYFIGNISSFYSLGGLEIGNNLFENIEGCFEISNFITVDITALEGGELTGGPFEFCAGDSIIDLVSGVVIAGNNGDLSQWVITNDEDVIIGLPGSPEEFNFDGGGPGNFFIWHVSYIDTITGLLLGNDLLSDPIGCFALSNPITVVRNLPDGGEFTGGPFELCVGDTIDLSSLVLSGNVGENSQLVITDNVNIIISLPDSIEGIDFNGMGPGTFLIWNISSFDTLLGLDIDNDLLLDVTGCFALSNSISVTFSQPVGGVLTGGPFEFCVGDTIPDNVFEIVLTGNVGATSQYVIVDSLFTIISLPDTLEEFDFNELLPGGYLIVHISYNGQLTGLEVGNNLLSDVDGCLSLSNSLVVVTTDCQGIQNGGPVFDLKISPNPITDIMTLKMLYSGEDVPMVKVFDASGRLCFQQAYENDDDMKIRFDNFAEGCYFIHVQSDAGFKTKSVLVVK